MHRLQLEPCCQRPCVTPEQRDNLGWKLEGYEAPYFRSSPLAAAHNAKTSEPRRNSCIDLQVRRRLIEAEIATDVDLQVFV